MQKHEFSKDRGIYWDTEKKPVLIKEFSPKIQKVLLNNSFPKEIKNEEVESSYIYGSNGSGKTILAAFMLLQEQKYSFSCRQGGLSSKFITIPELLLEFRECYSKNPLKSEKEILEEYSNFDLLVLDDFGVEKTTDWSFQMLYVLIDRRYNFLKKTIFTSNFDLEQLAEKLGDDRISSRIQEMCKIIYWGSKNYRKQKSND